MNAGSAGVPSGLAAVLFATVAIFILVLSVPVLGTRITRRQAGGAAVAFVALVALIAEQTGLRGDAHPLAALALLAAAGMHATVYVLVKRDGAQISPLTLNTLPMGLAARALCVAGALVEHPAPAAISGQSLLALLYLGAIASVIGFLAYFELLRRLGPLALSLVFVLFPVVAQIAAVIGGEHPMGAPALGLLALVLAASVTALTGHSPAARTLPRLPLRTLQATR